MIDVVIEETSGIELGKSRRDTKGSFNPRVE